MTEDLVQKYAAAALAKAAKVPAASSVDDLLVKYTQAALAAKKEKQDQKQQKKEVAKFSPPEKRLTYSEVDKLYTESGVQPARRIFFFEEGCSCIQAEYLEEPDRKIGNPIGALLVSAHKQKPVEWFDEPSNKWALGCISKVTGLSTAYLTGFNNGFDGHAPGHRLCSYDFHCGYADGRIIAALLFKQGRLAETGSQDPWIEVNDTEDLNELVRVQGYWRDEWGPKPKYLTETTDLTQERLQELGLSVENIS